MFVDALNPIIVKKSMKENWKIKRIIIYLKKILQTTDHCKRRRDYWIKERIKIENSKKVIYKLFFIFSLIIFLEEWGDGF